MFIVYEFINKYATRNVWNVSEEIVNMAVELSKNNKNEVNNNNIMPNNKIGAPS